MATPPTGLIFEGFGNYPGGPGVTGNYPEGPGGGGGGGGTTNEVYDEIPPGSGNSFTLARVPNPAASLQLFQYLPSFGSILIRQGVDYTVSGSSITTVNSIDAGALSAWYTY